MIFVTGDTHGQILQRFTEYIDELTTEYRLTKDDYVVVLGDFGGVWSSNERGITNEEDTFDIIQTFPWTTLFIDGNHENFDRLKRYPVKEWHGGKVHEIRPDILHLMRGEVFDLCGKKCFCFGGAMSHDIRDGILRPSQTAKIDAYYNAGKMFRVNHVSWWKEELPSDRERKHGLKILEKNNNSVDYIFTHDAPTSIVHKLARNRLAHFMPNELNEYLEKIKNSVKYDKWFFGHYHDTVPITTKHILMYTSMIRIV